ncbi:hypothetical protein KR044_012214 [Drosophila immigrans]|nr:hypothetical protein KR044_012214 [Drosophila immigrans]
MARLLIFSLALALVCSTSNASLRSLLDQADSFALAFEKFSLFPTKALFSILGTRKTPEPTLKRIIAESSDASDLIAVIRSPEPAPGAGPKKVNGLQIMSRNGALGNVRNAIGQGVSKVADRVSDRLGSGLASGLDIVSEGVSKVADSVHDRVSDRLAGGLDRLASIPGNLAGQLPGLAGTVASGLTNHLTNRLTGGLLGGNGNQETQGNKGILPGLAGGLTNRVAGGLLGGNRKGSANQESQGNNSVQPTRPVASQGNGGGNSPGIGDIGNGNGNLDQARQGNNPVQPNSPVTDEENNSPSDGNIKIEIDNMLNKARADQQNPVANQAGGAAGSYIAETTTTQAPGIAGRVINLFG